MDAPAPPSGPRTRGVLLVIGAVVVVLCVVFGVTMMRQKAQFEEYRVRTLDEQTMPWTERTMTIDECVGFTIDWGMACPGVESWCSGHAPRLTIECLESTDRRASCDALGDDVAATSFGYTQCEERRESVDGRYAKRAHKKLCAASYRAVAEHCREVVAPS